jgi:hypothetical protein
MHRKHSAKWAASLQRTVTAAFVLLVVCLTLFSQDRGYRPREYGRNLSKLEPALSAGSVESR